MILFVFFVPIITVYCRPEPQGYNYPKALTSYGTPAVNNYADNGLNGNYLPENQAPVNNFANIGYNYPENQSYKPTNGVSTNNNYNNQNNANNGSPVVNNYGYNGNATPNNQSNVGVIVHKHVYFHVPPPDNEEEQRQSRPYQLPPSQKHYKIIFIKAPSQQIRQSQNIPLPQQNEEKTIVYVLVKKPEDVSDVQIPTIPPTAPSKPEVYFIKYKTQKSTGGGYGNSAGNNINGEISITTAPSIDRNGESGNNITPAGIIQGGSISDALLNAGVSITDSVTETTTIPSYTSYTTPGVTGPY